jgi:hypothetical protein
MHEPVMTLLPSFVGLATTVGVGALLRMKASAGNANHAHEQVTERGTDQRARAKDEKAPK